MKKVVFVTNTSWYAYNFYKEMVSFFIGESIKVCVVSPDDEFFSLLNDLGASTQLINFDRKGLNPINDLVFSFNLIRFYKRLKPDFVFNFTIKPNVWSGFVCGLLKIPYVNTVSGMGSSFISGGVVKHLTSFLYRLGCNKAIDNIVMNQDDFRQLCDLLPKDKNVNSIAGTGIDLNFFKPSLSNTKNRRKFLFVGRLLEDKGVNELLEAFNIIDESNITLDILGDFDEGNPSSISKELFLSKVSNNDKIYYHGYQSDVINYIEEASFVVLPSYREGLPRVLMESLAMGKPILASNVPGCKDLVNVNTGFSFDAKSPLSLKDAILKAIHLDDKKYNSLSLTARFYAVENLDQEKVISHYYSYLNY